MKKKRTIIGAILFALLISAALNWRDLKKGFIDGFKDGISQSASK